MNRATHGPPPAWPSPFPVDVAFQQAGADAAGRTAALHEGLLAEERELLPTPAAESRVQDFTLGRVCARRALAALAPQQAHALLRTPLLREGDRRPAWPAGFVGAITHHRGCAAAAAARAADYLGLGLDLEAVRMPSPGLVQRILRPEERERWAALGAPATPALRGPPSGRQDEAFMRLFSAKESLFKALFPHTGVYLGFQDASIVEEPPPAGTAAPQPRALRWRLHKDSGPGFPVGREGVGCALTADGYVLTAVWVRRPAPPA